MPKDRARAKLACRIAGVDPDRFNEFVAADHYPCAPATSPGSARIFDINDILALRVFRHLTEEGMSASKAGPAACGLRNLLNEYPDADRVIHVKDSFGTFLWLRLEDFDRDDEYSPIWSNVRPDVVSFREWRLKNMRAYVLHHLNEEDRIAGEE